MEAANRVSPLIYRPFSPPPLLSLIVQLASFPLPSHYLSPLSISLEYDHRLSFHPLSTLLIFYPHLPPPPSRLVFHSQTGRTRRHHHHPLPVHKRRVKQINKFLAVRIATVVTIPTVDLPRRRITRGRRVGIFPNVDFRREFITRLLLLLLSS